MIRIRSVSVHASEDDPLTQRYSSAWNQARNAAQAEDWPVLIPLLHDVLAEVLAEVRDVEDGVDHGKLKRGDKGVNTRISDEYLDLTLQCLEQADFQAGWELAKLFSQFPPALADAAIAPLLALLQQPETRWETQWFAAQILGRLSHPAIAPALVEQLRHWNSKSDLTAWADADDPELQSEGADIRTALLAALTQQGKAAILPLQSLLLDPGTRKAGVMALGQIRIRETVPPLRTVVNDADPSIRALALEALSSFRDPSVPPLLVRAITDEDARVRCVAVAGVGVHSKWVTTMELVPLLTQCLWDSDLGVCQQAAIAMGRRGDSAAIPALVKRLSAPQTALELKLTVIRVLGWINDVEALKSMQTQLLDPTLRQGVTELEQVEIAMALGQQQQQSATAVAIAIDALRLTQPPLAIPVRQALITSLGQLREPEASDILVECMTDAELTIRLHASAALKQISPREMSE